MILLNFGWMVDLAMSIFEFLTKFLVFWHPWHPWVCIRSVCWKWNLKQIRAIAPSVRPWFEFSCEVRSPRSNQNKLLKEIGLYLFTCQIYERHISGQTWYKFKAYVIELIFKSHIFESQWKSNLKGFGWIWFIRKSRQSPNSSPHISTTEVTITYLLTNVYLYLLRMYACHAQIMPRYWLIPT